METELVAVIPTRRRPHALALIAERFAAVTTGYRIIFVMRADDRASRRALDQLRTERPEVDGVLAAGGYPAAVNAGVRASREPLILVGADDIKPHPGWLETAKTYMSEEIGFVSLNDLGNHDVMAGKYATLPLVARWYADSEGDLYHEAFQHTGCDLDASLRAQQRGAYAYAADAVMEHLHPVWGKGEVDPTYRRGGMNDAKRRADDALVDARWPGWQQTFDEH